MHGLALLVGHLVGDYIFQTDWQARNKTNPWPGRKPAEPPWSVDAEPADPPGFRRALDARNVERSTFRVEHRAWLARQRAWRLGHLACTVHCLLYTLAVWLFTFTWMPWWGLLVCFLAHWPLDRFRLAGRWMRQAGQAGFASAPPTGLAPWSIILVDNTFHLVVLVLIGSVALK